MSTMLIGLIAALALAVLALGYLWLFGKRRSAKYRAYVDAGRCARRGYRGYRWEGSQPSSHDLR